MNNVEYDSFIALQDHLHRNICRMRRLVAIGTHDLDTISGPYRSVIYLVRIASGCRKGQKLTGMKVHVQGSEENKIRPAKSRYGTYSRGADDDLRSESPLERWSRIHRKQNDRHLNRYLPIIRDAPAYPIIYDSKDRVLSMPPIINSQREQLPNVTCTGTNA